MGGHELSFSPETIRPSGLLALLTGPSGVGKDASLNALILPHQRIVTHGTRYQGINEIDGKDYYFTSPAFFEKMVEKGKIYEYYRNPRGDYYGTSLIEINNKRKNGLTVWRLNPDGAFAIIDDPEKRKFLEPFVILCLVAPLDTLEQRIINRGRETGQLIAKRKDQAQEELFLIQRKIQMDYENEELVRRFEPAYDERLIYHNGHGWHDDPVEGLENRVALKIIENREGFNCPDGFPRTIKVIEETITSLQNQWHLV